MPRSAARSPSVRSAPVAPRSTSCGAAPSPCARSISGSEPNNAVARVVAFIPDLLFGSNVVGALQAAGHEVKLTAAPDADGDVLVVDLSADVPVGCHEGGAERRQLGAHQVRIEAVRLGLEIGGAAFGVGQRDAIAAHERAHESPGDAPLLLERLTRGAHDEFGIRRSAVVVDPEDVKPGAPALK